MSEEGPLSEHSATTDDLDRVDEIDDDCDDDAIPELSGYEVLEKIAVGGMAAIYVARRHETTDLCVIKQLHGHLARDPVVSSRFLREAEVAALLNHTNIARLSDAGRENKVFYLAMDFIAGKDLESMMFKLMEQRRMLPPQLSVTATLRTLEGLEYAHSYRDPNGKHLEIVHRDLSPRNVMLTFDGEIKIIDFGLARTNLGDFRTAPGMVLGTLRYMSPEQAVAEPVDRRSDLFSWGVVLYEMLSGRPLVNGQSAQEILHAVVTQIPPPLSEINPNLPKELDAVLEKAIQKDREERFDSAEEFRAALEEAAGDLGRTPPDHMGQFVGQMFPEDRARSMAMIESAAEGEYSSDPTRIAELYEVTRAGQMPTMIAQSLPETADISFHPALYENTRAQAFPKQSELASTSKATAQSLPSLATTPETGSSKRIWIMLGSLLVAVVVLTGAIVLDQSKKAKAPVPLVVNDVEPTSTKSPAVRPKVTARKSKAIVTPKSKHPEVMQPDPVPVAPHKTKRNPTKTAAKKVESAKVVRKPARRGIESELRLIRSESDAMKAGQKLSSLAARHLKGRAVKSVQRCVKDNIFIFQDKKSVDGCINKFRKARKTPP